MIDRAIGIAGLALALLGFGLPLVRPKFPKRLAIGSIVCGLILLGVAGGILWLPVEAQSPSSDSIVAPGNRGIITQGQSGGSNTISASSPRN
jgi:hypothetical protein